MLGLKRKRLGLKSKGGWRRGALDTWIWALRTEKIHNWQRILLVIPVACRAPFNLGILLYVRIKLLDLVNKNRQCSVIFDFT